MGARVVVFALSDGWPREELALGRFGDGARARAAVEELFPGRIGDDLGESTLDRQLSSLGSLWVATAGSTVLLTGARLRDAVHLARRAARGRRDTYVLMNSVSDYLELSTSDGRDDDPLARSVALNPDMSLEDADMFAVGPELAFEVPFWAGERYDGFDPDDRPAPDEIPFSALQLGEEALRAFFGFTIEGERRPDDLDPRRVVVHGFRWADAMDDGVPEPVEAPDVGPVEPPGPARPDRRSWWRRLSGRR